MLVWNQEINVKVVFYCEHYDEANHHSIYLSENVFILQVQKWTQKGLKKENDIYFNNWYTGRSP